MMILFCFNNNEGFKSINNNDMDDNKLVNFDFPEIPKVIQLSNLKKCSPKLKFYYGYNQHYIWNNGDSVTIDVLRQNSRNYMFYNDTKFHLRGISFERSNLLLDNKTYLLQINLIHSGTLGQCDFKLIIPLEFSNNESDIDFIQSYEIPKYKCCDKIYGKVIKHQLDKLSNLLNQSTYKKYDINNKHHLLFANPLKISSYLGLDIINKLNSKNEHNIKIEDSWLDKDFLEI